MASSVPLENLKEAKAVERTENDNYIIGHCGAQFPLDTTTSDQIIPDGKIDLADGFKSNPDLSTMQRWLQEGKGTTPWSTVAAVSTYVGSRRDFVLRAKRQGSM